MSTAEASTRFTTRANELIVQLQAEKETSLIQVDSTGVRRTTARVKIIRHAFVIFRASMDVLELEQSNASVQSRTYLQRTLPLLYDALNEERYQELSHVSISVQLVLDGMLPSSNNEDELFATVPDVEAEKEVMEQLQENGRSIDDVPMNMNELPFESNIHLQGNNGDDITKDMKGKRNLARGKKKQFKSKFMPEKTTLKKRQKVVLSLYVIVVLAAVVAVAMVTINFIDGMKNPSGVIESTSNNTFLAPVVTVCLSQTGIPLSRLQLFNFTDAEGRDFVGTNPRDRFANTVSPEFSRVVDRFWDNPLKEDCSKKVGDFFPFPLLSLNNITSGSTSTSCRACFRVGFKQEAFAKSTAFQNSSVLNFYTDTYFLQCLKSDGGVSAQGLTFLHNQISIERESIFAEGVLSINSTVGKDVTTLTDGDIALITKEQVCNIFYFAFFPAKLKLRDPTIDISYEYIGTKWVRKGKGPYFRVKKDVRELLPAEALQLFVEGRKDAKESELNHGADLILIGPNTQTFATLRRLIVFDQERYDISSSTSNLFQSDIAPIFGYWLVYRIYYNYNRFVTDTWYEEVTYPVFQWLADVLGYLGLFTGVSVFSLLMLPVLSTIQKRDRTKLRQRSPEGYIWLKHKKQLNENANEEDDIVASATKSIVLPGYNV